MRYWAYMHDQDDQIVEDLDDHDTLSSAIGTICERLESVEDGYLTNRTFRVVDKEAHHQTVWIAGPVDINAGLTPLPNGIPADLLTE